MDSSVTTHRGAIAIDWDGGRLVVEANLTEKWGEKTIDIAIPMTLRSNAKHLMRLIGKAMGYRLGSSSMSEIRYPYPSDNFNVKDYVDCINEDTGNGRYYINVSIIGKIPLPCPICKVSQTACKPWGKTYYYCRGCDHSYGTAPAYMNCMGEAIVY